MFGLEPSIAAIKAFNTFKENNIKNIIELGSGNGASKVVLKNKNIILTDIEKHPWISKIVDMNNLKLEKKYIKKN